MSTIPATPATSVALVWKQADHDVHVATRNGEFAGFITVDEPQYLVHDARSTPLGTYFDLDEARAVLEGRGERHARKRLSRYSVRRIRRALA
ncbi:MAG: hypothetical protein ACQEW8_05395 [Actinomycetota bacterium]